MNFTLFLRISLNIFWETKVSIFSLLLTDWKRDRQIQQAL